MMRPSEEVAQIEADGNLQAVDQDASERQTAIHRLDCDTLYAKNISTLNALVEPIWSKAVSEQSVQQNLRHLMLGEDIGLRKWSAGYLRIRRLARLKTITLTFDAEAEDKDSGAKDDEAYRCRRARKAICAKRPQEEHPDEIAFLSSAETERKFLNGRACSLLL
ncbi:hypothetical protein BDZ45DRAFT_751402 [Acephala macrosclerotiorum]|nr:hypothetical protein BDZ45DRAFT_751402 [Acephala macrosclerotiorum]